MRKTDLKMEPIKTAEMLTNIKDYLMVYCSYY